MLLMAKWGVRIPKADYQSWEKDVRKPESEIVLDTLLQGIMDILFQIHIPLYFYGM